MTPGAEITASEIFHEGDTVHVVSTSKGRGFQGVGTSARHLDREALVAQGGRDEVGDVRLVVDDEDARIGHPSMVPSFLV